VDEPDAPAGAIGLPEWVSEDARKEYDRIVPIIREMGIESPAYMAATAMYCQAFARWADAEIKLSKSGLLIKDDRGRIVRNPLLSIVAEAQQQAMRAIQILGLAPTEKHRLATQWTFKKGGRRIAEPVSSEAKLYKLCGVTNGGK
jgi:P27 family predicted phage terminase small subunit